ncbi:GntR family transcriptional regulator [Arthrobacter woluwensis]|uniref:GntR family transcriptional regulator n=1 Tax=Arthrobacter woluwensis TaxID=156980 RepID=UPI001643EA6C|nr:GntR family transcriptional regulator [Arthrobacter woluwensis]
MNVDHTTPPAVASPHSFAQRLEHWISSGVWPAGSTLPSVHELGRIFSDQDMAGIQEVLDGLLAQGVLLLDAETGRLTARAPASARDSGGGHSDLDRTFGSAADRVQALGEARNALLCQCVRRLAAHATLEDLDHLDFALGRAVTNPSAESLATFDRELVLRAGNGLMLRIYDRLMSLGTTGKKAQPCPSLDDQMLARTELLTAICAQESDAATRFAESLLKTCGSPE